MIKCRKQVSFDNSIKRLLIIFLIVISIGLFSYSVNAKEDNITITLENVEKSYEYGDSLRITEKTYYNGNLYDFNHTYALLFLNDNITIFPEKIDLGIYLFNYKLDNAEGINKFKVDFIIKDVSTQYKTIYIDLYPKENITIIEDKTIYTAKTEDGNNTIMIILISLMAIIIFLIGLIIELSYKSGTKKQNEVVQ